MSQFSATENSINLSEGWHFINEDCKQTAIDSLTLLSDLRYNTGDPLNGGGFVVLNGISFNDEDGSISEYDSPYPGSNIFSLASGGAIYVRDPHKKLALEQLNGGVFNEISDADWDLILPYLEENEKLFAISIDRLLTVDNKKKSPQKSIAR